MRSNEGAAHESGLLNIISCDVISHEVSLIIMITLQCQYHTSGARFPDFALV